MATHDRRPVCFAYGRYSETTVVAGASIGATTFSVVSATNWSAGRQAYCSESGGTEHEWLGKVISVDGTSVTVTRGLTAAKSGNWKIWTALYAVEISFPPSSFVSEVDAGVEYSQSVGGRYYATQTRDSSEIWTLAWEVLPASEITSYRALLLLLGAARCVQVAMWELEAAEPIVAWCQVLLPDPPFAPIRREQCPLSIRLQYLSSAYQA